MSAAFDKSQQVDVVYTDFSKAFDTVDHYILLCKLERIGFCGGLISLFRSYLNNRTMRVRVYDSVSEGFCALFGVSQGSHLGPLLFILFINDLVSNFKFVNALMYADDFKIFSTVKSYNDCRLIQDDLNALSG